MEIKPGCPPEIKLSILSKTEMRLEMTEMTYYSPRDASLGPTLGRCKLSETFLRELHTQLLRNRIRQKKLHTQLLRNRIIVYIIHKAIKLPNVGS